MTASTCTLRRIAIAFVSLAVASLATAQSAPVGPLTETVKLNPPAAADLATEALLPPHNVQPVTDASFEPVQFAWPISGELSSAEPFVAESRQYWKTATAGELRVGVTLHTESAGALIRISPLAEDASTDSLVAIDPSRLEIETADGVRRSGTLAMEHIATAEQLRESGAPFPEKTSAFQLAETIGAGPVVIRAEELPDDETNSWLLHVYEPSSEVFATASMARDAYLAGDTVTARVALVDHEQTLDDATIEVCMVSPSGEVVPVETSKGPTGGVSATATLPADAHSRDGLWEIHGTTTSTIRGQTVIRDVRTAFAAAARTARLAGSATVTRGQSLEITVPIEVAAASRYEIRGVLYASRRSGPDQPVAVAHSARWLQPGTATLTLAFPSELVDDVPPDAALQIRDLRLIDSARTGLLHRQEHAIDIN